MLLCDAGCNNPSDPRTCSGYAPDIDIVMDLGNLRIMKTAAMLVCFSGLLLVAGCSTLFVNSGVRGLPVSHHAVRAIDRSLDEATVTVHRQGVYTIFGGETDDDGLEIALKNASRGHGNGLPLGVRAGPHTVFSNVWPVVRMASVNGYIPRFEVRVPEQQTPRCLAFDDAEAVVHRTNAVHILLKKRNELRIEGSQVTREQFPKVLQRLSAADRNCLISVLVAGSVSHQDVVDVLDECEGAGFEHRLLNME